MSTRPSVMRWERVAWPTQSVRHRGDPLTGPSGKAEILYVGAEWCPYCAAQRWSLVVALSRFGDFQGLRLTSSSSSGVFPKTPTLSFAGSSLRSGSIDFVAVDLADRQRKPLASPTAQENQLLQTYDPQAGIPFVDIATATSPSRAVTSPMSSPD